MVHSVHAVNNIAYLASCRMKGLTKGRQKQFFRFLISIYISCQVGRGISGHIEMDDPSAAMAEDHQYNQDPESGGQNREEID